MAQITFYSDWLTATATIPSVEAPAFLNATITGVDEITLSWGPVAGVDGYQLEASEAADFSTPSQIYQGTDTTFAHKGLIAGVAYYYRVRSFKQLA